MILKVKKLFVSVLKINLLNLIIINCKMCNLFVVLKHQFALNKVILKEILFK